jgi:hypothetical protein
MKNEIVVFIHCRKCVAELPVGFSPRDYAQIEVGYTKTGYQVWCKRHECHIEFIPLPQKDILAPCCEDCEVAHAAS